MVVWGSGGDTIVCGTVGEQHCHVCERERPFDMMLSYRYWGLYWIFSFVTKKKYYVACRICNHGTELDAQRAEKEILHSNPIPFMRRFGLAILVAGVSVLGLLGAFADA